MSYHIPVLLNESIEGLKIKPDGVYVDVTFGGGGHSAKIVEKLKGGHLYGFDQDVDAKINAEKFDSNSFTFIEANFRHLKRFLKVNGVKQIDGLLADLGISSHQINVPERGFSTRFDAALDMRMDTSTIKTAREVVNEYSEGDLHKIFGMYGEIRNAKTLAAEVVKNRINKKIETTEDFKFILMKLAPKRQEFKYMAQVFQALRIEVNDELRALEDLLKQAADVIAPGGRLVVISYHSLEDRLVKNFVGKGVLYGEPEKDIYGNYDKPFQSIYKKPIEPSEEEIKNNNRARSAKLRIAEKN